MKLEETMELCPENLAETQRVALLTFATEKLNKMISHLTNGEYNEAYGMLESSPSGDGYGCDNSYICFAYKEPTQESEGYDISDLISDLERLSNITKVDV